MCEDCNGFGYYEVIKYNGNTYPNVITTGAEFITYNRYFNYYYNAVKKLVELDGFMLLEYINKNYQFGLYDSYMERCSHGKREN